MWIIVIANAIALVSAAIEFTSNTIKRRKTTIKLQIVSRTLDATTDLLLSGFSGLVVDAADAVRNALNYKDKLTPHRQFLLVLATIVLIPFVNNLGIIGLLPLLATVFFTLTAHTRDPFKFKLINAINFLPWVVYDFTIHSYVSMAGDILSILLCVVAAFRIKRREDKAEKRRLAARERARRARQLQKERAAREARLQRLSAKLTTIAPVAKKSRRSRRSVATRVTSRKVVSAKQTKQSARQRKRLHQRTHKR